MGFNKKNTITVPLPSSPGGPFGPFGPLGPGGPAGPTGHFCSQVTGFGTTTAPQGASLPKYDEII